MLCPASCLLTTLVIALAHPGLCRPLGRVLYQQEVRLTGLDAAVTVASLIIHDGEDPVAATHAFAREHAPANRNVLWSMLDHVCVVSLLECPTTTELLAEPLDFFFPSDTSAAAAAVTPPYVSLRIGDSMDDWVDMVVRAAGNKDTNLATFLLLRKVCSVLPGKCAKDKSLQNHRRRVVHPTNSTARALEQTFRHFEDMTLAARMSDLTLRAQHVSPAVEGNLWTDASLGEDKARRKRECALSMVGVLWPPPKTLLEVGFNAGHSLEMFLAATPSIVNVLEFDACTHSYAQSNFNIVKGRFPDVTMILTCGDSKVTLAAQDQCRDDDQSNDANSGKGLPCADVVHIDGGHDFDTAWLDIVHARALSAPHALVILDNVDSASSLGGAVAAAVDAGVLDLLNGRTGACQHGSVFARFAGPR